MTRGKLFLFASIFFFPFPFLIDRREVGANNNNLSKVPDLGLLVKKENQLCGDELALKY